MTTTKHFHNTCVQTSERATIHPEYESFLLANSIWFSK